MDSLLTRSSLCLGRFSLSRKVSRHGKKTDKQGRVHKEMTISNPVCNWPKPPLQFSVRNNVCNKRQKMKNIPHLRVVQKASREGKGRKRQNTGRLDTIDILDLLDQLFRSHGVAYRLCRLAVVRCHGRLFYCSLLSSIDVPISAKRLTLILHFFLLIL